MLDGHGKEWARLMLDEILRLRAEVERKNAVVGADGIARKSTRASARHLETVLGGGDPILSMGRSSEPGGC
jgi:hypothetical protein